jgi:hypothetical protein
VELKPRFIHHPESKQHLQRILVDLGCIPSETCFEVPKMRSSACLELGETAEVMELDLPPRFA